LKILIITQYYYPENFIINDIVKNFKHEGYDVEVLTAIPNYPSGNFFSGYNLFNKHKEIINDVVIHRSRILPRFNGNKISLIFNYISFVFFGILKLFFIKGQFDKIFIYAPSPITVGLVGIFASKKFNAKSFLWVQDLWPESVSAGGNINNKFILHLLDIMTKMIYKHTDYILVQSESFVDYIINQGVKKEKIKYLPNYAVDIYSDKKQTENDPLGLFSDFTITFAGNIGKSQNLEILIEAAKQLKLKSEQLKFLIIGSGRNMDNLLNKVSENELSDYFIFLGRKNPELMPSYFYKSNALFISLKKSLIFSLTIPSKLQSYMAFGKPIIGSIDGITNELIIKSNSGLVSSSEDVNGLVKNIIIMKNFSANELNEFGDNASKFYKNNFSKKVVMSKLFEILE
jgi:glycosyltransferase involved in cell wall biosynthesis